MSGRYYDDEKERRPNPLADDEALAEELRRRSVQWTREPARQKKSAGASATP